MKFTHQSFEGLPPLPTDDLISVLQHIGIDYRNEYLDEKGDAATTAASCLKKLRELVISQHSTIEDLRHERQADLAYEEYERDNRQPGA